MESIIDFVRINYQWIFSGIGVAIISFLFMKKTNGQNQTITESSSGNQAGRDIIISSKRDKKPKK